ncbi:uncharacterized protein LOC144037195 isoform X2 [Vanacampus margaritifer]
MSTLRNNQDQRANYKMAPKYEGQRRSGEEAPRGTRRRRQACAQGDHPAQQDGECQERHNSPLMRRTVEDPDDHCRGKVTSCNEAAPSVSRAGLCGQRRIGQEEQDDEMEDANGGDLKTGVHKASSSAARWRVSGVLQFTPHGGRT